jgi:4-amino-4-deoxy-L-arabinose transferase-like glycosyltransferase
VSIKTAGEFPRGFFLYHNATVFAFYSEAQPLWYYFPQFFCGFLPWSVFLPFALIAAFPRERREETLFPLVWFLWIFVFFTFVMYKRSDYILPLYPAAALLTAVFWESVEGDGARWRRHAVRFMVWLLIGIIGLACVVVTVIAGTGAVERIVASPWLERYSNATDRAMMLLYAGVLRRDAIWLVGVSAGVALFIYSQLRRFSREGSGVRAIIVGITVAMIFLNGYYLYAIVPEIDKKISLRPYAIFLSDRVEPGEPLALYDFWFYEFAYYMDRRVTELSYPHELRDYFADEGPRYCLVRKKHLDEARAHLEGAPYRIEPSLGDSEERFVMFVKYEGMEGG